MIDLPYSDGGEGWQLPEASVLLSPSENQIVIVVSPLPFYHFYQLSTSSHSLFLSIFLFTLPIPPVFTFPLMHWILCCMPTESIKAVARSERPVLFSALSELQDPIKLLIRPFRRLKPPQLLSFTLKSEPFSLLFHLFLFCFLLSLHLKGFRRFFHCIWSLLVPGSALFKTNMQMLTDVWQTVWSTQHLPRLSKASFVPSLPRWPLFLSYKVFYCDKEEEEKPVGGVLYNGTGGLDWETHMCEYTILLGDERAQ